MANRFNGFNLLGMQGKNVTPSFDAAQLSSTPVDKGLANKVSDGKVLIWDGNRQRWTAGDGPTGPTGTQGPIGVTGPTGPSNNISLASFSTTLQTQNGGAVTPNFGAVNNANTWSWFNTYDLTNGTFLEQFAVGTGTNSGLPFTYFKWTGSVTSKFLVNYFVSITNNSPVTQSYSTIVYKTDSFGSISTQILGSHASITVVGNLTATGYVQGNFIIQLAQNEGIMLAGIIDSNGGDTSIRPQYTQNTLSAIRIS